MGKPGIMKTLTETNDTMGEALVGLVEKHHRGRSSRNARHTWRAYTLGTSRGAYRTEV